MTAKDRYSTVQYGRGRTVAGLAVDFLSERTPPMQGPSAPVGRWQRRVARRFELTRFLREHQSFQPRRGRRNENRIRCCPRLF